jgi:type 1 fimbria pilin
MATTLTPVTFPIDNFVGGVRGGSWTGLANGESGAALFLPAFSDRTVQISGTFGAGGSVTMQGSLDGTNWFTLTDPQGNNITKTAASLEAISEATPYIRPTITAGDGTTSLTIIVFGISKGGSL